MSVGEGVVSCPVCSGVPSRVPLGRPGAVLLACPCRRLTVEQDDISARADFRGPDCWLRMVPGRSRFGEDDVRECVAAALLAEVLGS